MLSTASKYPKKNLDCSLTLQNSSQKKWLGFESDVYHFDTCPRLLGLSEQALDSTVLPARMLIYCLYNA